jgi:putative transposase
VDKPHQACYQGCSKAEPQIDTNAIESLNMSLRKAIKIRGPFPSEDAALKVMYLALRNLAGKWHSVQNWREALNCFAMLWEDRFPATT